VILLREWRGLSYAEIAEALEVSVAAVETLVFRGRRDLAKALASEAQASTQLAVA
jgi:DNA-directed RNA polymerase specialized sigma24 family protein